MRFSESLSNTLLAVVLSGAAFASPLSKSTPSPVPVATPEASPILPQQFAGWQRQSGAQTSHDAAAADPTNAAILKEYGFTDFASSTYTKDDGRTLKLRAARFADASGAFGAYTFYLQPNMTREQIGDQGASLGQRVLFYRGHVLIDALFSRESPMSGAELRELAGLLPRPGGNAGTLPPMVNFMPRQSYVANTQKYVVGPSALSVLSSPVSAELVDFNADTEVALGRYTTPSGEATLMLIYYPNAQSAAEHLKRIDAAHKLVQSQSGVATIGGSGQFFDKRTGPIVAIASGTLSESDAKSLLGRVNYEANVTWSQASDHQVRDLYTLIVNIVILCAVLGAMAIVAGVAFGGIRILMKRIYPDRVFDRPEQMEFISLRLTETAVRGSAVPSPAAFESGKVPPNPR